MNKPPCDCIKQDKDGYWHSSCYCDNIGSAEDAATWAAYENSAAELKATRASLARIANFGCQCDEYGPVCDIIHPGNDEEWCAPCIAFRDYSGHPRSKGPPEGGGAS